MKKSILIMLSVIVAFVVSGCTDSIESKARKEMKKQMHVLAKAPYDVKVSDLGTMYKDDSLCIMHFYLASKDSKGLMANTRIELIYLIHGKEETALFLDLNEKESIMDVAKETYDELESKETASEEEKEKIKIKTLHLTADMWGLFLGYEVGKENYKDKYDISNW